MPRRLALGLLFAAVSARAQVAVVQVEADRHDDHAGEVAAVLRLSGGPERPVQVLDATDFFGRVLLRSDRAFVGEPLPLPVLVQNHSWVADRLAEAPEALAIKIIRAFDFQLARDAVVAVVSLRNDPADGPPDLLSHSYNAIVAGLSNGRHSAGLTRFDDPGRQKPDLVAPASHTSFAVPQVAAAAAVLLDRALVRPEWAAAARPEAVKALLLTGADRSPFPGWAPSPGHPLDPVHGAGQLDAAASLRLLEAGQPTPEDLRPAGWTTLEIPPGGLALVPVRADGALAAALCWLREVRDDDPGEAFTPDVRLPDHDLFLADGNGSIVAQSSSRRDNLEFIRHRTETPGGHVLIVRSDLGGRVALAWRAEAP